MDFDQLDTQEKNASANKKKTFRFETKKGKKYTVRTTYGILQQPCCGNMCQYCVYGNKRGSTEVKDIEDL